MAFLSSQDLSFGDFPSPFSWFLWYCSSLPSLGFQNHPGTLPSQVVIVARADQHRWLVTHGRIDEAEKIIADLEDLDIDDPWVITQSKDVQYAATQEKENAVPFKDLIRGRTGKQGGTCVIRRLALGAGAQAMQQFAGINVGQWSIPV